ncbi:MAG: cache domain-containing protein [Candidatus Riflebacteria bacterium]|nr:cache domain-containing protein [Candidatus Riflebacteria bacterium]
MSHQSRFRSINPTSVVYLITSIIVFLIAYLTIDSIRSEQTHNRFDAEQKLKAVVDLAVDDIARSLGSVRDSLRLLSRMPAMRDSKAGGTLHPAINPVINSIEPILDKIEEGIVSGEHRWSEGIEHISDLACLTEAFARRIMLLTGLRTTSDEESTEERIPGIITTNPIAIPIIPSFCQCCVAQLRTFLVSNLQVIESATELIDTIFSLGNPIPGNLMEVEGLLRTSLNDRDLIRSVAIQDMSGKKLVEAAEIGPSFQLLGGWSRKAISAGHPFYPGPVWFDEGLGKPLWQAAVPIRDLQRRPFGLLTSRIDLGFLQEIAAKSRLSNASYLLVVDEDGVIIGHPRPSQIIQQMNVSHSNSAVAEAIAGNDGIREISIGGTSFLAAYRYLKNVDESSLPGWGILYLAPTTEVIPSFFNIAFNAIAIALIALYVVFYLSGLILSSFEEEMEP